MRPFALAATATLLGACALAPVASPPANRTVTVRGVVAAQGPGYALQQAQASWSIPYTADAIATIHVALEQAPEASGALVFDDLADGDCDVTASADFPTPDYTALPVVAGSAPPLVIPGLPLGKYYRVTLQAESAASGPISCPAMSRRLFNTVGAGVKDVIATTFPVTLFKNPNYETNFAGQVNLTEGDVVASGSAGPALGAVRVVSCTPEYTVATGETTEIAVTTWDPLLADSNKAPIYVVQGAVGYRLSVLSLGLMSGYYRTDQRFQPKSPARKVCVELGGQSRLVDLWELAPS